MKRLTFADPLGPGTPTWYAFDRAVEARLDYNESVITGRPDPRSLKRYYNQRTYMLRRHNADNHSWLVALDEATGRRSA